MKREAVIALLTFFVASACLAQENAIEKAENKSLLRTAFMLRSNIASL